MIPTPTPVTPRHRSKLSRSLWWLAAALVLLLVFQMYRQPDFLVLLANQIWLCF